MSNKKSAIAFVIIGSTNPVNTHYLLFLLANSNYKAPNNKNTSIAIVRTPATNNIKQDITT